MEQRVLDRLIGMVALVTTVKKDGSEMPVRSIEYEEKIHSVNENGIDIGGGGWMPFVGSFQGISELRDKKTREVIYSNSSLRRTYQENRVPLDEEKRKRAIRKGVFTL